MSDEREEDLALAMIRLYGRDAQSVAMGHAETHAEMGDAAQSDKWQRVAGQIAALCRVGAQTKTPAQTRTKVGSDS